MDIESATFTPKAAASLVMVQLPYVSWACAKVFGKEEAKNSNQRGLKTFRLTQ